MYLLIHTEDGITRCRNMSILKKIVVYIKQLLLNISTIVESVLFLSREGHEKVVSYLLQNGADVELPDNYGQSPLFMACWKGSIAMHTFHFIFHFLFFLHFLMISLMFVSYCWRACNF